MFFIFAITVENGIGGKYLSHYEHTEWWVGTVIVAIWAIGHCLFAWSMWPALKVRVRPAAEVNSPNGCGRTYSTRNLLQHGANVAYHHKMTIGR
jgi:hypothetical protein